MESRVPFTLYSKWNHVNGHVLYLHTWIGWLPWLVCVLTQYTNKPMSLENRLWVDSTMWKYMSVPVELDDLQRLTFSPILAPSPSTRPSVESRPKVQELHHVTNTQVLSEYTTIHRVYICIYTLECIYVYIHSVHIYGDKGKRVRTTSDDVGGKYVSEKSKSTGGTCVGEYTTGGKSGVIRRSDNIFWTL